MATALAGNFEVNAALPLDHKIIKADIAARDAIPMVQRYIGMFVTVQDTNTTYKLSAPLTNSDWSIFGIHGAGSAESIAFWIDSSTLGSNIYFRRYNSTSVVYNNAGIISDYDTTVERYLDPAGSDSNLGTSAGSSNAWLTLSHAMEQCQQLGPGRYIIYIADGDYSNVSFDVPDIISRGLDSSSLRSIIQLQGNEGGPNAVNLNNTTGTIINAASKTTTLRVHGVSFNGNTLNNGTAISQKSGEIIFRNSRFNNFFNAHLGYGHCKVILETGVDLTSVYNFFTGIGTYVEVNDNINHTAPSPSSQAPVTFGVYGGHLVFGFAKTFRLICPASSQVGALIRCKATYINWGTLNTFRTDDAEQLFDIDSCPNLEGPSNIFMVNGGLSYCSIKDCTVSNSGTAQWWADVQAPDGVKLYGQAVFTSNVVLATGTPPIGSLQDYMPAYVQIQPSPNYTRHALDARYLQTFSLSCLGELPQGYNAVDVCPEGFSDKPYYIFTAEYDCVIILLRGFLETASGTGTTDSFAVAVNGVATSMVVDLANVNSNTTALNQVDLSAGDRVSFKATTDAATASEDLHLQILVMRLL